MTFVWAAPRTGFACSSFDCNFLRCFLPQKSMGSVKLAIGCAVSTISTDRSFFFCGFFPFGFFNVLCGLQRLLFYFHCSSFLSFFFHVFSSRFCVLHRKFTMYYKNVHPVFMRKLNMCYKNVQRIRQNIQCVYKNCLTCITEMFTVYLKFLQCISQNAQMVLIFDIIFLI